MTNARPVREEVLALSDLLSIVGTIAGVALGFMLMITSTDSVMVFHGAVFAAASLAAGFFLIGKAFDSGTLAGPRFQPVDEGYNDGVVKALTIVTVFWGVVGFLVGVITAWQLAFPKLNLDLPWT